MRSFSYHFFMIIFFVAFFITISPLAYGETGKKPDPISVSLGKVLYEKYCLTCHQKNGTGENRVPVTIRKPGYIPAMPLNESSHAWHHSDEQLLGMILEGTPSTTRMPGWKGTISVRNAKYIVSYIKSLWSPRIIKCQGPKHMSCM